MESDKENEKPDTLDIASLDTYALLALFINLLSAQAWRHMGLLIKPGTNKVETDLKRASVAIDCIAFLIDKLESQVQESERNQLRNLLADLQINFVRILGSK